MSQTQLKLIGLTGGAGSGKSTVDAMFRDLGAVIVDADQATREVYKSRTPGFDAIVREFGSGFVRNGEIDRERLGDLVFKDARARERLNAIVHPLVRQWMADRTTEAAAQGAGVVIHDVPLLFENRLRDVYFATVLVYAEPVTQLVRLTEQRGLSIARAKGMIASQMPIGEKKALADYIIVNEGSLDETRRQVEEVWARVRSL